VLVRLKVFEHIPIVVKQAPLFLETAYTHLWTFDEPTALNSFFHSPTLMANFNDELQASLVSGCHDFGASSSFSFTSSLRSWFWLYSWVVAAVCAIACFVPVATEQVPESEVKEKI
jgi:hypothetical protein